jgi:tetratricopeptide (TPR) repeat protein
VAEARGEWTEAEQRWRSFLSFDPNPWWAHTGLANALAQQGRAAEAESVLLAAQERLPQDGALFVDFAEIASREQQWPEAARRWATVRARWPEVRAYLGEGLALAETGRFDEADKVIEEAMKRFPSQHDPVAVYAEIAVRRKDWQTAVLRWTHARMLFPELEGFGHRLFEARLHLYDADPTDDRAQDEEVPAMPEDRRAMYDLMMSFESLGNGCEFGTVQRTYGAEPMGLLRWAAIGPQELVAALDSDFAGTGTLEQTNLWVHRKEYIVGDKKFNMGMHTFINEDTISHEKMLEQSCRRLKFLSKKLLEDIKSAEKIFVYLHPHLEASEVSALFKALRRHGKAWLLAVQVDAGTAAKVELVEPRLMRGYVPTAGLQPGEGAYKIPIESWAVICRAAFEHAKRELVGCAGTPGSI